MIEKKQGKEQDLKLQQSKDMSKKIKNETMSKKKDAFYARTAVNTCMNKLSGLSDQLIVDRKGDVMTLIQELELLTEE